MRPDTDAPPAGSRGAAWALWRQDDNGNRVRIDTFATREAALARQVEFERRHHKQSYWVEEA